MTPLDVIVLAWDDVGRLDATPNVCPNLEALRASGMDFPFAFSNPVCSQSRAVVLYGAQGRTLGILEAMGPEPESPTPPASWPTLARTLRDAGYRTALVGKWHLGPHPCGEDSALAPLARGFETWRAGTETNINPPGSEAGSFVNWNRVDADAGGFTRSRERRYATLVQVEEAEAWWNAAAGAPRFLYVALNDPHGPNTLPVPSSLLAGWPAPPPGSSQRDRFLAKLRAADTVLGRLLALPGAADAFVLVFGDNGTSPHVVAPGQDPAKVKGTTFDGGIRVPLVARWPGVTPGAVFHKLTHLVDVPKAILERLGMVVPAEWDGQTYPPRLSVISEAVLADGTLEQCARGELFKLRAFTPAGGVRTEELYDLTFDPLETTPLDLDSHGQVLAWLRSQLYGTT